MTRPHATITAELTEARGQLGDILARLDDAWARLHEQEPGYPSTTIGAGGSSGTTLTQPERLANRIHHDPAIRDLATLDRATRHLYANVADIYGVVTAWGQPTRHAQPTDDDGTEGPGPDWCRSCWRDDRHCEPVRAAGLCRWCADWNLANGQLPPVEILRARHQGRRITSALIDTCTKAAHATKQHSKKKRRK